MPRSIEWLAKIRATNSCVQVYDEVLKPLDVRNFASVGYNRHHKFLRALSLRLMKKIWDISPPIHASAPAGFDVGDVVADDDAIAVEEKGAVHGVLRMRLMMAVVDSRFDVSAIHTRPPHALRASASGSTLSR